MAALVYRVHGFDLDDRLREIGFEVDYEAHDLPELGILETEPFSRRRSRR